MENQVPTVQNLPESETAKTNGGIAGSLGFVDYVGLGCQTSHKNHPYFFLFSDIDTKDEEQLRLVQQIYATWGMSFFTYETRKGYHVISPCLLELNIWDKARRELKDVLDNFYRNLVIRVERKSGDSRVLYWDNFNMAQKYKVSRNFMHMMNKRFDTSFKSNNEVESKLFFTKYTQLRRVE